MGRGVRDKGTEREAPPTLDPSPQGGGRRLPDSWDADAAALAQAVTATLEHELGDELVSVIVHGSLAMGCYRAPKSDVDMLAVCAGPLSPPKRQAIIEALLRAHDARGSGAGLEMSLVTAEAAREAAHPMPFELHFGCEPEFTDAVRAGTFDYGDGKTDPDLAAHITVAGARGVTMRGLDADIVFAPMPWRHYMDALETDLAWALEPERLRTNTVYFVLNACRVLQIDALGEGTVMSKAEGAMWGIAHLPKQYAPMIEAVLAHYLSGEPEGTAVLDMDAVGKFAEFVRCRHS